jgi:hypothetical protein
MRRTLLLLFWFGFSSLVQAETNFVWSPVGQDRNVGSWQCATDSTPVLNGPDFNNSRIINFGLLTQAENVFICFADRPIGAGEGCPAPGNYSQERMAAKSEARLCQVEPPPTIPAPVVTFTIQPTEFIRGTETTVNLAWSVQNSPLCRLLASPDGLPVSIDEEVPVVSTRTVMANATGIQFSLSCDALPGAPPGIIEVRYLTALNPFVAPGPPPCWPTAESGIPLYEATTVDGHSVKVWPCDMADGFVWRPVGYDPSLLSARLNCIPSILYEVITAQSLAAAWTACVDRPLSPTEKVVADVLTQKWKPRFEVSGTSTITRRPVYTRNADGTRGVQLRISGVLQYILVREPCDGSKRLLGISTRYHSVTGRTSQQGQTLPDESFAQCQRLNPPATGWNGTSLIQASLK